MPPKKVTPAYFEGPMDWKWARLTDVAEVVNGIFSDQVPRTPQQIWEAYFWMTKNAYSEGTLSWWDGQDSHQVTVGKYEPSPSEDVFVPAGWVIEVLSVAARKAWRVKSEPTSRRLITLVLHPVGLVAFPGRCF